MTNKDNLFDDIDGEDTLIENLTPEQILERIKATYRKLAIKPDKLTLPKDLWEEVLEISEEEWKKYLKSDKDY